MILIFTLCLALAWGFSAAQGGGYFVAPENIEETRTPQTDASRTFIYRVESPSGAQFYRIPMNNILYGTKKAFLWPDQIPTPQRANTALATSAASLRRGGTLAEVIFNDHIILTESDSLFAIVDKRPQSLRAVALPGLTLLVSPQQALTRGIGTSDTTVERPLPSFYYALPDSALFATVRANGFYPREVSVQTPPSTFRQVEVRLQPLPTLIAPQRALQVELEEVASDSLRLHLADSLIQVTREFLREDSLFIADFLDKVRQTHYTAAPRDSSESADAYAQRLRQRESELDQVLQSARERNRVDDILQPLHERLAVLAAYRSNVESGRSWKGRGAQTALLKKFLWGRFFVGSQMVLGRQLPPESVDPGPTGMWGAAGYLAYYAPLGQRLNLLTRLEGSRHRWQYHKGVSEISQQNSFGTFLGVALPLAVAAAGEDATQVRGVVVQATLGATMQYRHTRIYSDSGLLPKDELGWGGAGSLQFLFTALPLALELEYGATHDGYGDLRASLAIPLWFLPRFGGAQ